MANYQQVKLDERKTSFHLFIPSFNTDALSFYHVLGIVLDTKDRKLNMTSSPALWLLMHRQLDTRFS